MRKETIARKIAGTLLAIENCKKQNNEEWGVKHTASLLELVKEKFPSGSGFDKGTQFDIENSTPEKLVFKTAFHHMTEHGSYDGWTYHTIRVRPSFAFSTVITITGPNRNGIVDYIHEVFHEVLMREIE
jgi:hypothetical protein